jgi:translocation and assembly module TamB
MKRANKFGMILAGLAIFIVVVAFSLNFVLGTKRFQQFVIHKITEGIEQATGGKTDIRALDFRLSTLTVHLYDITIHGSETAGRLPLLQVDKLTVRLTIQSVLRHKINLADLEIEHPVVHIRVSRDGKNNIPQVLPSSTSNHTSVFALTVGHVLLSNGEIDYNDQQIPMEAELYHLAANIHCDFLRSRYDGVISYYDGHLQYAHYNPLSHSLEATFTATPTVLSLEPAVLTVGSSSATLRIKLSNYTHPNVDGDYNLHIHAQDFAEFAAATKPAGDIVVTGRIHCPLSGDQPLMRVLAIDGEISSNALFADISTGRIATRKLHGEYRLAGGALHANRIEVESLDGIIRASLDAEHLDATPSVRARASFHGISLQAAQQALRRPELRQVALYGILDGKSEASWTGDMQNLRTTSDLTLSAGVRNTKSGIVRSSDDVPVDGVLHITYDGPRNAIGLRSSTLHIPSAVVTAQGEISDRSNLQVQITVSDLHQITALAVAFRPHIVAPPAIYGSATLNATVRGAIKKPEIAGELAAQNLKVEGSDWSSAHVHLALEPSQVTLSNGTLVSAERGRALFGATVSLRDWSYLPSNPINANLSVQKMSIADLERLANVNYPASGDLSAQISVSGSELNPQGSGTLQIAKGEIYGESVQNVAAKFRADGGSIKSSLSIVLAAGAANADLTFTPKTKAYSLRFDAPAVVLQKLNFVQAKNLRLSGTVSASIMGAGTLENPQLNAVVELPELTARDKSISRIKAQLEIADHKAGFDLNSEVLDSSVQAHGQIDLTGDYYTEAAIDTTSVQLGVLLGTYSSNIPGDFRGQTEFHATLKGPLKNRSQMVAHLTIPVLNATYSSLQIGTAGPVQIDYAHSVITIQPTEIRGTGTSLHLEGSIPLGGNSAASITAKGTIDVSLARLFLPDTKSSGDISLDIQASGTASNPNVNGQIHLKDVAMFQAGAPLGVEKLNGTIDIDNERIHLTALSGQVGGGELSAGGSIAYRPSVQFNLALNAKSVRLRYPQGLRSLLDGNLAFTGTRDSSVLNGRVSIDSLSFTPDFDLSKFVDQFSTNTATLAQPGFADNIRLSIALHSQEDLSASSSQISIEGRVNLRVIGSASNPVITGRTDLTSGELFYRNTRYQLQRGIITFDDPNQTSPILDVSVTSMVEQYNLTLKLRGPFDKLTTSYVSDPPLATADIINLLATGQTTSESAASQSTDSIIASQAASEVTGGVQKLTGFSSLAIDPLIGGSNQSASARIAVQQRVTKNFLFTFSTDVSQPGSEIVEGNYQINKRWSVSVARDEAGGVSTEGRLHTRF